jgi:hypothetical protein
MKKIAIAAAALALALTASSWPALAKGGQRHYRVLPERPPSQVRIKEEKAETCGDPYWDCCLSYYRGWGPGACGR